ncbi:hypothetical protein J5Y09_14885 [Roseomonas sp. PWR1]|uniref:Uncharacterized protein n=1 Tax=Roseomonas nitratireducens TaxID=2820810 RepID=A0ABS4AVC8_9PROT|nr:hypothetical protein [Neoroseomonas nitratireducens]MBP0465209.1 hypothetical protein [Neoroseomonas nitratireducens]
MDDIDRVFARFKDDKPEPTNRRETLNIPRRNGAGGSRTVEVVHVRSGTASRDRPQRMDPQLRAASWDEGFSAQRPVATPAPSAPPAAPATRPKTHVMPAWEPAAAKEASSAPASEKAAVAPDATARRGRGRPRKEVRATPPARHVADPFNPSDDGANCMRCGYAIEPTREKRGLLTCSECG